ncbi:MAG: 2Fe-2S iron-sulfur cluster-binding protein [Panacagrimonas sp.]
MSLQSTVSVALRNPSEDAESTRGLDELKVHRVTVKGSDISFPCREDDTILRAALRSGLGHPYECNSGGCGSCLFDLVHGEVVDHWPTAPGLSERSRAKGRRLACQSSPRGDCTIAARMRSHCVPPVTPVLRSASLEAVRPLTRDMAQFTFRADGPADFLPGQYVLLHLPGVNGPRAYSMSNLPNAAGHWEFIIKRTRDGQATDALFTRTRLGDPCQLDGPYGMAHLRTDSPRAVVCVGGGSGLSPLMSILSGVVSRPSFAGRSVHLFYGGRTPQDLCVEELIARDPLLADRVMCVTAISEAVDADAWTGERGFIHEVLGRWIDRGHNPIAHDFYFCGPPPMTGEVQRLLLDAKVPLTQLHFDRFL